jgi:ATP-binding cassette subfamily C (CFTR/MRP) protein 1
MDQVGLFRNAELAELRSTNILNAISSFVWMFVPVMVALVTFSVYGALGFDLTPTVAFSSVALFNVLRFPLNMLPQVFR